ncbi:MAG: hypothetical protein J2P57_22475, partial [Acidimicrobiaceae bacterium]|nr:hypothetical protein [Acidimicrobiaceae bacterium]
MSHSELAVAELLRDEGHQVRSLAERPGRGRMADLEACGQPIEVKSWLPQADRHGPPRAQSVYNKLASARSQASTVVLYGAGSGLTEAVARAGMAEFSARGQWGRLRDVRVVGERF